MQLLISFYVIVALALKVKLLSLWFPLSTLVQEMTWTSLAVVRQPNEPMLTQIYVIIYGHQITVG